jgi:integrase/recombinase XerD
VRAYIHSVEHFAFWLTEGRVPLGSVDQLLVRRFVTDHLPACECPSPCQRTVQGVRPALAHLLHVLRVEGWISERPPAISPIIQDELGRFDVHLDVVCGLAPATRTSRKMWVGKFLLDCFGAAPIEICRIEPADIVGFMARPTNHYRPGTMQVLGGALRSYLRFRALSCEDRVEALVAAVPRAADWRLATVPANLTPEEVALFLGAFDRDGVAGQRSYAMARCLLDMGMRASEVAGLQLDDLNWSAGTLTIGRAKSRRADVLPLPAPTGKAIVQYLRESRPQSTNRSLFLRHRAPFNAPITAEFVRGAVRRAFARCGLDDRFSGTHVLRHTAATRMRCAGATLKEIADVLRHRSLDTTTIYSKVDLPRLASVAAPWPGGQS